MELDSQLTAGSASLPGGAVTSPQASSAPLCECAYTAVLLRTCLTLLELKTFWLVYKYSRFKELAK